MSDFPQWTLLCGVVLVTLVGAGCSLTRAGYQSPKYSLKEKLGEVEVREYPELVLAETPSRLSSEGRDGGFMRLFRFISKGNARAQALPMTTPVFYRGVGEAQSMAFVMETGASLEGVPAPLDEAVKLKRRDAGTFAVLRLRKGRSERARAEALEKMREKLSDSAWREEGNPEFAFYDPPWIPSFLERNELVWRVSRK